LFNLAFSASLKECVRNWPRSRERTLKGRLANKEERPGSERATRFEMRRSYVICQGKEACRIVVFKPCRFIGRNLFQPATSTASLVIRIKVGKRRPGREVRWAGSFHGWENLGGEGGAEFAGIQWFDRVRSRGLSVSGSSSPTHAIQLKDGKTVAVRESATCTKGRHCLQVTRRK
jgi:hypothetical protein